jgi:hypothetical protein
MKPEVCRCTRRIDVNVLGIMIPWINFGPLYHEFVMVVRDGGDCNSEWGPAWGFQNNGRVEPEVTPGTPLLQCSELPCIDETKLKRNVVSDMHNPPPFQLVTPSLDFCANNSRGWVTGVLERSTIPGCCPSSRPRPDWFPPPLSLHQQ